MWADELDEAAALALVRTRFPRLARVHIEPIRDGWDTYAFLVDDRWIARVARRGETDASLRREAQLLARIAHDLPSPVPAVGELSPSSPVCLLTRRIVGEPASASRETAIELGQFLAALHTLPVGALPLPAGDVAEWRRAHEERRAQFEARVVPLLEPDEQRLASELFDSVELDFDPTVVHGDLGPQHVLCEPDGHIAGIIDWGDARIGDPAIDLAWGLHALGREFGEAVASAYGGIDPPTRSRARFYHRRVPWYEVLYGLERERPELVRRGLAGVRERLSLER
jgi:aminoglycoside phosphotransferase (APT) family kinase protein